MKKFIKLFLTGEDKPLIDADKKEISKQFNKKRWSVFLSITFGYALFYILRLNLSVIKKFIIEAGVLDATQIGIMGSVFFFTYGIGKFINSFLADRMNIKKFLAIGLLGSSIVSVCMGLCNTFIPLAVLWGINGWFHSIGPGSCVVSLNQWFSNEKRGTFFGIWYSSSNLGSAFTLIFTALIVSQAHNWKAGFIVPGIIGFVGVILIYFFMSDRPETYGLPSIADYQNSQKKSIGHMQLEVLKRPAVWILALAGCSCYIVRSAIESWGVIFLAQEKNFSTIASSTILSVMQVAAILGTTTCGLISDKFFNHKRNIPCLIYGILCVMSLATLIWIPAQQNLIIWISICVYGISIGALVCYLGGLMAVDICPKRVSGAAIGIIGLLSYFGASIQELISGFLLEANKTIINGNIIYNFNSATIFWLGSAILSIILTSLVWKAKVKE